MHGIEALHEPPREGTRPTLCRPGPPTRRFMVPMRVYYLEVEATHEPTGFMASTHVKNLEVFPFHEPEGRASGPSRAERDQATRRMQPPAQRDVSPYRTSSFMAPIRVQLFGGFPSP